LVLGIVKLFKTSSSNKKIVLKYFHPGELIGEVANFEQMPYPATAQSFTSVKFLKIDFEKLQNIINLNPTLSLKIQASLIKKIKNLERVISSDLVLDAKQRVAKYIYDNPVDFFIQKNTEIAEILNITPETLSRILKAFKQNNIIDIKAKTFDKEQLITYF
jgi:CRP/FNR family transcriptional regulator